MSVLIYPSLGSSVEVPLYPDREKYENESEEAYQAHTDLVAEFEAVKVRVKLLSPKESRHHSMCFQNALHNERLRLKGMPDDSPSKLYLSEEGSNELLQVHQDCAKAALVSVSGIEFEDGTPMSSLAGQDLINAVEHCRLIADVAAACRAAQSITPEQKKP